MSAISEIGLFAALVAGAISFLSPCVLPLVPGYVSFISGSAALNSGPASARKFASLLSGASFVAGFSTIFVALGASATLIGQLLLSYRYETAIIGGLLIALFGIVMTGLVPMPWFERDILYHGVLRGGPLLGPYVLGVAFGFGWMPCIGPVLDAILTAGALSSKVSAGIVLLSVYSLGLGIPFLLSAAFTDGLVRRMDSMHQAGRILKICGRRRDDRHGDCNGLRIHVRFLILAAVDFPHYDNSRLTI